jgi:hypothetical protein
LAVGEWRVMVRLLHEVRYPVEFVQVRVCGFHCSTSSLPHPESVRKDR